MKLSLLEIDSKLSNLKNWSLKSHTISKDFIFSDFISAFSFMTKVAMIAEKMNHHPDWSNVYNRLTINLSTHDVGGLSNADFELAAKIDELKY